ncbi:hypothetical protein B0H19DRAFT_1062863 [Mycena capillaripes]|nr:hypothetical protein B0H19DRAFT_1062863 [Mycena capillaripes]
MAASILVADVHTNLYLQIALGGGLRISKALVKGKALAKGASKALADFSHASSGGRTYLIRITDPNGAVIRTCIQFYSNTSLAVGHAWPRAELPAENRQGLDQGLVKALGDHWHYRPLLSYNLLMFHNCGLALGSAGGGNPLVVPTGLATVVPTELATSAHPGQITGSGFVALFIGHTCSGGDRGVRQQLLDLWDVDGKVVPDLNAANSECAGD